MKEGIISYSFLLPGAHVTIQANETKAEALNFWYLNRKNTLLFMISFFCHRMDMMLEAMRDNQKDESYVLRMVMRKTPGAWYAMLYIAALSLTRLPESFLFCKNYKPPLG